MPFQDNCYGPAPTWTLVSHPTGYNFDGMSSNDGIYGGQVWNGFPEWVPDHINALGDTGVFIDFYYTPTPNPPVGSVDSANCPDGISGWAVDKDRPNDSIQVHIYIDGINNVVTANVSRPDVNQNQGVSGNHGFKLAIPDQFKDSNTHTVDAYAIDVNKANVQTGNNPKIGTTTFRVSLACGCDPISKCDVCPNLPGIQFTIPDGYEKHPPSEDCVQCSWFGCINDLQDYCPNIPGYQSKFRAQFDGYVKLADGNCYKDTCPNLPGLQTTIPPAMIKNAAGECITPPKGCPSLPDVRVTVTLNRPHATGGPYRYGYWGGSHDQYETTETRYSYHEDISNGGNRTPPTLMEQQAGNPGYVKLDYSPYLDNYPFDVNVPRVYYHETYTEYYYTYTGGEVWDPVYAWAFHGDSDGDGPDYDYWYQYVDHYQFMGYAPVLQWTRDYAQDTSVDGQTMNPCYNRNYDGINLNVAQSTLTPDRENPDKSNFTASVDIQFGVERAGVGQPFMRRASQANGIPYSIDYQIVRAGRAMGPTWTNQTNSSITVTANSTYQHATGNGPVSASIPVSVEKVPNDLRVGDKICWRVTVNEEKGIIDISGNRSNTSGSFQGTTCSPPVVNWPYFKVFGNDVVSGGQFGGSCAVSSGRGIQTHYRAGEYRGSSTQYAAFALSIITGFTTASLRDGATSPAKAPFGLSFANVTGYGGSYSGADGMTCLPDYFAGKPPPTTTLAGAPAVQAKLNAVNTNPRAIEYYEVGPITLGNTPVASGSKKVIYVNGTLTINGNITTTSTWNNRDEVPYVMFIARDIVIGNSPTNLDGVYVAQPGGAGTGTINTCAPANFYSCGSPLIVNGAFIAENIKLNRTRGSLRNAVVNEGRPGIPLSNCSFGGPSNAGTPGGSTCAAEVISFSPETFMALSQILAPQENFKLDSYVNLPPNL